MNATHHFPSFRNTLRISILSVITLAPGLTMSSAYACAACGCTLSTDWSTQGIATQPGFSASVAFDTLNQNQQRYGTGSASAGLINNQLNAGQEVEAFTKTETVTTSLMYNDVDWGVNAQFPYVTRTHGTYGATAPLGSSYSTSSDSGLGDVKITGHYTGFSADQSSGLIAGFKLPTGSTSALFKAGTAAGTALDAGLQIGTGSTDLILGGYTTGAIETYGWFAQATYQRAIATSEAIGNLYYRPGDALSVNTGVRYAAFGAKVAPMLQLNIIKRQADQGALTVPTDPITGVPVSGGTLAYLAPGVTLRLGGGASLYSFIQLPVYQNVNSLQLTPKYTYTLGVRQSY